MPGINKDLRFPFISLEKAVQRAKTLYQADQRGGDIPNEAAFHVWGYNPKSSGGFQTVAALKLYGMATSSSKGLKLTKEALDYFREERDEPRAVLARTFALAPPLLRNLWSEWEAQPPQDSVARSQLKVGRGLNEQSARSLLGIYKDNLAWANLASGGKVAEPKDKGLTEDGEQSTGSKDEFQPIAVGDYVTWTSAGVDQFAVPRRVNWVSEDGTHLRVHGSMTGIPVGEVSVVAAPTPPPIAHNARAATTTPKGAAPTESETINVLMTNGRLQITADVDAAGLQRLRQMLDKYEDILKLNSH